MGWMRLTFDTGAAVTAFPLDVGSGTHTDPSTATYKTASGEILQDQGGVRVEGTSEHDSLVAMQGRTADVHKILLSAAQAHSKGYMSIWVLDEDTWCRSPATWRYAGGSS